MVVAILPNSPALSRHHEGEGLRVCARKRAGMCWWRRRQGRHSPHPHVAEIRQGQQPHLRAAIPLASSLATTINRRLDVRVKQVSLLGRPSSVVRVEEEERWEVKVHCGVRNPPVPQRGRQRLGLEEEHRGVSQ